jgi:hypothetical protein
VGLAQASRSFGQLLRARVHFWKGAALAAYAVHGALTHASPIALGAAALTGLLLGLLLLSRGLPPIEARTAGTALADSEPFAVFAASSISLACLALSPVASVVAGRPWELAQTQLERIDVGKTGVSIALPPRLARLHHETAGIYWYASPDEAPLAVQLVVLPWDPRHTADELHAQLATRLESIKGAPPEAGFQLQFLDRVVLDGGQSAVRAHWRNPLGLDITQYFQIIYRAELVMTAWQHQRVPGAWSGVAERIAGSARLSDGLLPSPARSDPAPAAAPR